MVLRESSYFNLFVGVCYFVLVCILLGRKRIDLNFYSIDYHLTKTTGIY